MLHQAANVRCCRKVKKNEAYGKSQWVLKLGDFFRKQMFHEVKLWWWNKGTVPCCEEINDEQGEAAVVNYFTEMFSSERLKKI